MATKKKATKANFTVDIDIYNSFLLCSFGETDQEFRAALVKYGLKDEAEIAKISSFNKNGAGYCVGLDDKSQIIRMVGLPDDLATFGSLQHEILHCTFNIMRHSHIPLTSDTEEAFTYLHGYLTRHIHRQLDKYL